jgi:hypothetical protein
MFCQEHSQGAHFATVPDNVDGRIDNTGLMGASRAKIAAMSDPCRNRSLAKAKLGDISRKM